MEQFENLTAKEKREVDAILENLELAKVIMYIYKGQALEMDIKDFCMKYEVFYTEDAFDYALGKMLKAGVVKTKTYPNTANVVIIGKKCLNRFMCQIDDSIDFSSEQVKLNTFLTSLVLKHIEKPEYCNVTKLMETINSCSTFLHKKYDVENGYNFFKRHFKLNSTAELQFRCAMYRSTKGLKNINNKKYSKKDDLEGFTNSFATFVNKNIYTLYKDDICTFFILDLANSLDASKVGKAIGFVIGTLFEQLEEEELTKSLKIVNFEIITRKEASKDKLMNSFKSTYYDKHTNNGKVFEIKRYKQHLLDAVNKGVHKRAYTIKADYEDKNKESDKMFEFYNIHSREYGLNLDIKVINANLDDRLTMHNRIMNIKTARKIKHEKELKAKLRNEIEDDIRKEYEAIYSARDEEIRKQILREYNLDQPFIDDEINYL